MKKYAAFWLRISVKNISNKELISTKYTERIFNCRVTWSYFHLKMSLGYL